ncbi:MAG: DUF1566 domain-containing protein, partial [Hyphomicrobiales bacterium]|nr:DUF1566 domain-containing protein [Hyphomicrobiales bacterium]
TYHGDARTLQACAGGQWMAMGPIGGTSSPLTTLNFVTSSTGTGTTITIPGGTSNGDLAIIWNYVRGTVEDTVPEGFSEILNDIIGGDRAKVSAKILDGSETTVTGLDATSGANFESWVVAIFRPDASISGFAINSVNGEATDSNPSPQTISASGASTLPVILIGQMGASAAIDPRSTLLTEISSTDTRHYVHWFNYASAPVNQNYDMDDEGRNVIQSGYLTFTQNAATACNNPDRPAGSTYYNYDYRVMTYCDGANWVPIGKATTALRDDSPDAFGFTDQSNVALSTLIESNIVQITGLTPDASVSIGGDGSPEYRICDDGTCTGVDHNWSSSAGTIDNGQYLQLRLTSSAANSTMNSATVTVGSGSDQWDVTTEAGGPTGCPSVGDLCSDGSYYIGQVGGNDIYATAAASQSSQTWNNGTTNWTTTGFTSTTDGPGNTAGLVALSGAASPYDAAVYCDGLSAHSQTDWYLPARDELNLYWNGGSPVAGVLTNGTWYWSSTENNNSEAWAQRFNDGTQDSQISKSSARSIRCVRNQ